MPPPQTQAIDDKIRALADLTTALAQDIARKHAAIKRAADEVMEAINDGNLSSSDARAYTTRLNHAWVPYPRPQGAAGEAARRLDARTARLTARRPSATRAGDGRLPASRGT